MKIQSFLINMTVCWCVAAVGCNSSSTSPLPGTAEKSSAQQPKLPVIQGASLADLKAKLGAEYSAKQDGLSTTLARKLDPHEIVVTVQHTNDDKVQKVSAYVFGPRETGDVMDQLYTETAGILTEALSATSNDYWTIALLKVQLGMVYDFSHGGLYFVFTPDQPLIKSTSMIVFKPGYVKRYLGISPALGGGAPPPAPIAGSSVTQLEEILKDFEVKAKVDGEQIVYLREAGTHKQFVICFLTDGDVITRLEAQVVQAQEGQDIDKLNDQFWRIFANLKYKNSSHDQFIAFLDRPKMQYAVGEGDEIGAATVYLPVGMDGKRRQLNIWAKEP